MRRTETDSKGQVGLINESIASNNARPMRIWWTEGMGMARYSGPVMCGLGLPRVGSRALAASSQGSGPGPRLRM